MAAFRRRPNQQCVFALLTALLAGIGLAAGVLYAQSVASKGRPNGTEPDDQAPVIHPKLWPESKSPIGLNPKIERRIDLLLNRMTVEEKIGQVIQPEWKSISPVEVAQYHIGSIEAGGGSAPGGNKYATVHEWVSTIEPYYDASVDPARNRV